MLSSNLEIHSTRSSSFAQNPKGRSYGTSRQGSRGSGSTRYYSPKRSRRVEIFYNDASVSTQKSE